jgi:hypothetical protein
MAKLIRSAIECAYKIGDVCLYPPKNDLHLNNQMLIVSMCKPIDEENFSKNCPLENGIMVLTNIEEVIQLVKKEGLLYEVCKKTKNLQTITLIEKNTCGNTHKHTYYKNGERVYPIGKRNRKNCHWHLKVKDIFSRCQEPIRDNYFCSGVNCGYFKAKQ